jgi:hypothetical protein
MYSCSLLEHMLEDDNLHSDESVLETHDDHFELDILGVDFLLLVQVRTIDVS